MVIHSYISLPEGKHLKTGQFWDQTNSMFGLMVIKPTPCDQTNYSELYMFGLMVRLIYTCLEV